MAEYVVAKVTEIPPGERKLVEIRGRSIGIFNVEGEFFALKNRCPHEGGPLCEGYLSGFVSSKEPGEYSYTRRGEILRCPWHAWEFDLRTGQSWFDPSKTRVRSYDASVVSGEALTPSDKPLDHRLEAGPYVAETYEVSIEEEYVVIQL